MSKSLVGGVHGCRFELALLTCQYRPLMPAASTTSATRDRLLDTAAELFYADGITATGVDAVVARSGVSKPTLYRHFGSKAALVAAVLEDRHLRRRRAVVEYAESSAGEPRERLLAIFGWLGAWHRQEGWRGCAFLNAAAEIVGPDDPARDVIARHKHWMHDYLAQLAGEAGLVDADALAYELMLLIDGANARVLAEGDLSAAARARRVAQLLVADADPTATDRPAASDAEPDAL